MELHGRRLIIILFKGVFYLIICPKFIFEPTWIITLTQKKHLVVHGGRMCIPHCSAFVLILTCMSRQCWSSDCTGHETAKEVPQSCQQAAQCFQVVTPYLDVVMPDSISGRRHRNISLCSNVRSLDTMQHYPTRELQQGSSQLGSRTGCFVLQWDLVPYNFSLKGTANLEQERPECGDTRLVLLFRENCYETRGL